MMWMFCKWYTWIFFLSTTDQVWNEQGIIDPLNFPEYCGDTKHGIISDTQTKKVKVSVWVETRVSETLLQTQPVVLLLCY